MKTILKLILFSVMLQSFQCSKSDETTSNVITPQQLLAKKTEIINYINSFSCSNSVSCDFIAFGSKPCGGPREYLVFSSAVNLTQLQQLVANYNQMETDYNIQINAVSDCAIVLPPNNVGCVNGVCSIIN